MAPSTLQFPISKTALQLFREALVGESSEKLLVLQLQKPCLVSSIDQSDVYKQHDKPKVKIPDWLELPISGIHELYGDSGTGKTQVALSLCLQAALRGQKGDHIRSVYLYLNGSNFLCRAAQRLSQMAFNEVSSRKSYEHESIRNGSDVNFTSKNDRILKRIALRGCMNIDDLFHVLETELPLLLQNPLNHIRLLVIDSVSDLFRGNLDFSEVTGPTSSEVTAVRSSLLFRLTSILKSMSDRFHPLAIVVINQATADFSSVERSANLTWSATPANKPALGLSWSHSVNSRFCLARDGALRSLHLMKSSRYKTERSISFVVTGEGCFITQK
jgi:Rad51